MDISIIIVSYNTKDLLGGCIRSVLATRECEQELFVVDNASKDGSAAFVETAFPAVHLIANNDNRGFAAANNQALPLVKGRYILFLNPDTMVPAGSLAAMITFMDAQPRAGLAGTKILNPDGTEQWSISHRYPGQKFTRHAFDGLPGSIACVLGAAMIARTDLIRQLGGFDESFFLYGEDQDLCLRIRQAGYEIGFIENAPVMHVGGQSERESSDADIWGRKVAAEFLFYWKHYDRGTIHRISRTERLKALWRIVSLRAMLPFTFDKSKARAKLTKYSVIYEFIKSRHSIRS
jgi:N-acetylglucosaminyl-diphospho-decaprenol L-rhamnosyltransferase